jgi:murein DD-endopeptidase MepM/ murein hydrolase activator NlpD
MYSRIFAFVLLATAVFGILPAAAGAQTPDIQAQIQDRSKQLDALNQEIQATQNTLNQVQKQKSSLQTQLKSLDTSIQQLNLNIKADAVTGEQLGFQVMSLQGEIDAIAAAIQTKRAGVIRLFQELQRTEDESLISILLRNKSLASALSEAQAVENVRSQFSIDIIKLNQLSDDYQAKIGNLSSKKQQVALHQENLANRKVIVQDQEAERKSILEETKNQESVYQSKISELKQQQDALQNEIAQMERQLGQNFNTNILPAGGHGILAWPLQDIRITQHFGERSYLYHGKGHNGVDFAASIGTPVFAAADGVIMAVDNNDRSTTRKYQYGKYVLIKHPNNLATIYGHLSRQVVSAGQSVKRGDLIGYSGSTGYATGPHLHFGLYWAPSIELKSLPPAAGLVPVGVVLNPEEYL